MQILVTISAAKRLHVLHPEMVRERADQTHRLLKAVLDLEAQAIQANDLDGAQGSSAMEVTNSEGGILGRTVRSQEPKEFQTNCG